MKVYPDLYLTNIKEITLELLRDKNIKGLILDVDNTLIDYDKNLLEGAKQWCDNLKRKRKKLKLLKAK